MTRRLLPLLAAALLLPAAPAAAQDEIRDSASRPHTVAKTRERDGLLVSRLEATVRREGRFLLVRLTFTARTDPADPRRIVVRAGRCTSGALPFPNCPPEFSRSARVRGTLRGTYTFPVRVPPARQDAIRIAVNRPGEVVRRAPGGANAAYAQLALRGSAWRGQAGDRFGLEIADDPAIRVTRATADVAGLNETSARPTFAWTATAAADTAVETLESVCTSAGCPPRSFTSDLRAGRQTIFQNRPVLRADEPRGIRFALRRLGGSEDLFRIALPSPG